MYRTLLILLYGSGLRIGEALRLTLRDVDIVQRIITVRNTKFFKTRLVPIGPKLAEELAAHIARRRQLSMPAGEDSALFATRTGRAWYHRHVVALFQQVRRAAQIGCPTGELRPPRLHDLRHTAAVHRVLVRYRSGKDVQRLLPQLATYLGHVEIKSTQRYLQMTPELLQEASRRFAHYSQLGAAMNDRNLLGPWVRRFLLEHLLGERNLSRNTQVSYRDTLTLLLPFASAHGGRPIDRMTVEDLSPTIVRQFLDHLERDRHCNGVTRNQRLCAIHSLARFVGMRSPVHLAWCTEVRSIPFKKTAKMQISYLEKAEMDALLKQPDQRTALGARDHALLLFLYNSGARADEAAQLTIGSLRLSHPPSVRILGKGNKIRMCPLWTVTSSLLTRLIACRDPNDAVFLGRTNKSMTRFGIHRIVAHYATLAGRSVPSLIAKRVSPHTIRHTTAVHLLRAGVDINTILEMKAKTLASLDISKLPPRSRRGIALPSLMAFLEGL